jgi:NADH-quinone oxidoreductase subunit L
VFVAGGLALAGLPFSSGFYSKDEILAAVYQKASLPAFGFAWLLLLATAGITAFYTTRPDPGRLHGKPGHHDEHVSHDEHHELHKRGS